MGAVVAFAALLLLVLFVDVVMFVPFVPFVPLYHCHCQVVRTHAIAAIAEVCRDETLPLLPAEWLFALTRSNIVAAQRSASRALWYVWWFCCVGGFGDVVCSVVLGFSVVVLLVV